MYHLIHKSLGRYDKAPRCGVGKRPRFPALLSSRLLLFLMPFLTSSVISGKTPGGGCGTSREIEIAESRLDTRVRSRFRPQPTHLASTYNGSAPARPRIPLLDAQVGAGLISQPNRAFSASPIASPEWGVWAVPAVGQAGVPGRRTRRASSLLSQPHLSAH